NSKGLIQRINYYSRYGASELSNYEDYTYDNKNRVARIVSYSKDRQKDNEWEIAYDNNNHVAKVRSASSFGFTDYVMKYNTDGLLTLYTELYNGKEKQGETRYSYDSNKKLIQVNYQTSSKYADTMQCWYRNNEKLYYRSHLKYPRAEDNDSDFAHEFLVFSFKESEQ
ncbi:MAG TPA: hypothetical protein VET23_04985, partial [Chitinophagaceae bacterium]|nr:hypothetical protein [Chitinophagaceae bacterium]